MEKKWNCSNTTTSLTVTGRYLLRIVARAKTEGGYDHFSVLVRVPALLQQCSGTLRSATSELWLQIQKETKNDTGFTQLALRILWEAAGKSVLISCSNTCTGVQKSQVVCAKLWLLLALQPPRSKPAQVSYRVIFLGYVCSLERKNPIRGKKWEQEGDSWIFCHHPVNQGRYENGAEEVACYCLL